VGKPEGKRPLGRPRRRWVDNIRIDLGEIGWSDVDWIGVDQDRDRWRALVNAVMNTRGAIKCWKTMLSSTELVKSPVIEVSSF
jgi:alpha-amylase/alpha-mannosidase (GH57 family)